MKKRDKERFINGIISKLTLDEKIGATLTMHYRGSAFLPILDDIIIKYNIGGIRLVPGHRYHEEYIDCTGEAGVYMIPMENEHLKRFSLNRLRFLYKKMQEMAISRRSRLPLHMAFDWEGEFSGDFKTCGGAPLFPPPMGIVASGQPTLAYDVARTIARVARSVCANMIHSPCLDVNVNPRNPEINTRAYSDIAEKVAEYALESCRGFAEGGLIATAKHFPGRGNSDQDAHDAIPVIPVDFDTFWNVDLLPYRVLIEKGMLPALMTAHSLYPAVDPDHVATLSPKILQGIVREKLGFKGVITSDAIGMRGITLKYSVPEGSARALAAGVDMVLLRMPNLDPIVPLLPQVIDTIRSYVESGQIKETELDQKVYRILEAKYNIGLFHGGTGWKEDVDDVLADENVVDVVNRASSRNVFVVRKDEGVMPLPRDAKALVIEQTFDSFLCSNDDAWPPGLLYESLLRYSHKLSYFELPIKKNEACEKKLLEIIHNFPTLIVTNWTRRSAGSINELIRSILVRYRGTLILIANTPYEAFSVPREVKNVIVHFGLTPRSVETAVDVLFGIKEFQGKWPIAYRP